MKLCPKALGSTSGKTGTQFRKVRLHPTTVGCSRSLWGIKTTIQCVCFSSEGSLVSRVYSSQIWQCGMCAFVCARCMCAHRHRCAQECAYPNDPRQHNFLKTVPLTYILKRNFIFSKLKSREWCMRSSKLIQAVSSRDGEIYLRTYLPFS